MPMHDTCTPVLPNARFGTCVEVCTIAIRAKREQTFDTRDAAESEVNKLAEAFSSVAATQTEQIFFAIVFRWKRRVWHDFDVFRRLDGCQCQVKAWPGRFERYFLTWPNYSATLLRPEAQPQWL